jgi:methyl-accepting chemotaxis protein
MAEYEEYELVPMSPLRRMEKRVERLEKTGSANEILRELVDIVKTNQKVVDDVVKINSDAVNKITELTEAVKQNISKIDDFLGRVEFSSEKVEETEASAPVVETKTDVEARLDKLEKRINTVLLSALAKNKRMMVRNPARPSA